MGVFTTNTFEGRTSTTLDDLLNDNTIDVYSESENAAGQIIYETEYNWSMLMKQIGLAELAAMEREGQVIYEAADGNNFFKAIGNFFKKLWDKIKSLFKTLAAKVLSISSDNSKFINRYKKQIQAIRIPSDFTYKGYKFTNVDIEASEITSKLPSKDDNTVGGKNVISLNTISSEFDKIKASTKGNIVKSSTITKDTVDKFDEDKMAILDSLRGNFVGNNSGVSEGEFVAELKKYFRNGQTSPEELSSSDIDLNKLVSEIEKAAKYKTTLDNSYRKIEREIKDTINATDKLAKQYTDTKNNFSIKNDDNSTDISNTGNVQSSMDYCIKAANIWYAIQKECYNLQVKFHNAHTTAVIDRARQNKSILIKLMSIKGSDGKRAINASADMTEGLGALNVNFI